MELKKSMTFKIQCYFWTLRYCKHLCCFGQINFNSENVPHCANFDIDVTTNTVKCPRAGFTSSDEFDGEPTNREITAANTKGPIVPLGSHYGTNGIP